MTKTVFSRQARQAREEDSQGRKETYQSMNGHVLWPRDPGFTEKNWITGELMGFCILSAASLWTSEGGVSAIDSIWQKV
jgi:hypothetical protein